MAGEKDIHGVLTDTVSVGVSGADALFLQGNGGQCAWNIKYITGGSLLMIGWYTGATLAGATLDAQRAAGHYYLFGTSEALALDGPTRFYLLATGATVTFSYIRAYSQNMPTPTPFQVP